jgi:PEP-CTERM motif-containing protein
MRILLVGLLVLGLAGKVQATTTTEVSVTADLDHWEKSDPVSTGASASADAANGVWETNARAAATASETTNRVTTSFDHAETDSQNGGTPFQANYPVVLSYSLVSDHGALLFSRVFNLSESTVIHDQGSGMLPLGSVTSSLTVDLAGGEGEHGGQAHAFSLWQQTFTEPRGFMVSLDGSLDHQDYTTHLQGFPAHGSKSVLDVTASFAQVAHVPEPSTWLLLGMGVLAGYVLRMGSVRT